MFYVCCIKLIYLLALTLKFNSKAPYSSRHYQMKSSTICIINYYNLKIQKEKTNILVLQDMKTHFHLRETLSVKLTIKHYCGLNINWNITLHFRQTIVPIFFVEMSGESTHTGLATLSPNSRFDWPWSFNERRSDGSTLNDWSSRDVFLDESPRSPKNKAARKAKKKKKAANRLQRNFIKKYGKLQDISNSLFVIQSSHWILLTVYRN